MDISLATPLLGGLSPRAFMRRHWQKRPLLVRGALAPQVRPAIDRAALFALADDERVQSRLVERRAGRWTLRHGPFARRALPPLNRADWTLLVQGVDLHLDAGHRLLSAFRFVPDARLDDLMVSYASDGGGVGPHVDSYDVFLLQLHGRRRWRIGPCEDDPAFVPDLPLKILRRFEPQDDWLLEPGDMLYLPPGWAHDGVAVGECLTASIGFRAAGRDEIVREVLQRWLDADDPEVPRRLYRDPGQAAVPAPGRIPDALQDFAARAVARALADRAGLDCSLGEWLSEPAPGVVFDAGDPSGATDRADAPWCLDRGTRMLYDDRFVFINGESFRAGGRDAMLMRGLADRRRIDAAQARRLSDGAHALLADWAAAGWIHRDTSIALRDGQDGGDGGPQP